MTTFRNWFFLKGQKLIASHLWYLAPLSWLFALAVWCRHFLYDRKCFRIHKVPMTVVSVGNIRVGGTGKTPFVHLLATAFPQRKVAILFRRYGPTADEAMMMRQKLPGAKIYVGKNRIALAEQAIQEGAELLILDDGLQYRSLHRDVEIILGDQKGKYLPYGFLRDSPKKIAQADALFSYENNLTLTVKNIKDQRGNAIPSIAGWEVAIFSAIADPKRFKKTVEDLGAKIVSETIFADHEVPNLSLLPQKYVLLCTEKDFVKLAPNSLTIYFLEMEMVVKDRDQWEMLIEKINQKIDNYCHV